MGAIPRRWWVSSAQQPSLMYQIPAGTGAPRTTGPSVAVSARPILSWAGTGGVPPGGSTAPVTTCSMVAGTAVRCGKVTSTQATSVAPGAIVTEAFPGPGSVTPSAGAPTASGVRSTRPVVPGTRADVAASCSSTVSTRKGTGAELVRTSS